MKLPLNYLDRDIEGLSPGFNRINLYTGIRIFLLKKADILVSLLLVHLSGGTVFNADPLNNPSLLQGTHL